MNRLVYLRAVSNKAAKPAAGKILSSREQALTHEVRNCMSILFLALTTLERDGEQWKLSERKRQALEDVVLEVNRMINEMLELTKDRTIKSHRNYCLIGKILNARQNAGNIVDA